MRLKLLLAPCFLAAALLAAACGSSDPAELVKQGNTQLNSGDSKAALASYEKAIDAIGSDRTHASYKRAHEGAAEALITTDAKAATTRFLELARDVPAQVTDKDFNIFGAKLAGSRHYLEAIDVMDAGLKAHSESAILHTFKDQLVEDANSAGDSAAIEKLAKMGYLGGGKR